MAESDKKVKIYINGQLLNPYTRQRKKIICKGNEYPMSMFEEIWRKPDPFCIMEMADMEEYEQQVFVWNREVILNLN